MWFHKQCRTYVEGLWEPQHLACPGQSWNSGPGKVQCLGGRNQGGGDSPDGRLHSGWRCQRHRGSRKWERYPQHRGSLLGRWAVLQGSYSFSPLQKRSPGLHAHCSKAEIEPFPSKSQLAWMKEGKHTNDYTLIAEQFICPSLVNVVMRAFSHTVHFYCGGCSLCLWCPACSSLIKLFICVYISLYVLFTHASNGWIFYVEDVLAYSKHYIFAANIKNDEAVIE